MDHSKLHIPVLLHESIDSLQLIKGDTVVDCTVNRGGHAEEIAKSIGETGTLITFDLDKQALVFSTARLQNLPNAPRVVPVHANYRTIKAQLREMGIEKVDAIFADLGLSSQELDVSGRGFSFQRNEPLHMTFQSEVDQDTFTAKDLLNNLSSDLLANIFRAYGDEPQAKRIAEKIVEMRTVKPIETTQDLVDAVIEAVGKKPWQKAHPATRVFQAIRIAVNDEYEGIKELLNDGFEILKHDGRFSIITFHSGEDRIVKTFFKEKFANQESTKPLKTKPTEIEIKYNPRSRSAILRTITKI
jgi:16S rRNA (cytosine1402-N4)-methyltransferase